MLPLTIKLKLSELSVKRPIPITLIVAILLRVTVVAEYLLTLLQIVSIVCIWLWQCQYIHLDSLEKAVFAIKWIYKVSWALTQSLSHETVRKEGAAKKTSWTHHYFNEKFKNVLYKYHYKTYSVYFFFMYRYKYLHIILISVSDVKLSVEQRIAISPLPSKPINGKWTSWLTSNFSLYSW